MRLTVMAIALAALCADCRWADRASDPQARPRLAAVPENPCDVLTAGEVSAITGVTVVEARRVRSILDETELPHGPGSICRYRVADTSLAIRVSIPPGPIRGAAEYRKIRDAYVRSWPDQVQQLHGLGADAWMEGGNWIYVLVREDLYFTVMAEVRLPRSRDALIDLARAVLERL